MTYPLIAGRPMPLRSKLPLALPTVEQLPRPCPASWIRALDELRRENRGGVLGPVIGRPGPRWHPSATLALGLWSESCRGG